MSAMLLALRSAILHALADIQNIEPGRLVVRLDGWNVSVDVSRAVEANDISETEQTILKHLTPPCTCKMLADRCGYTYGGWFRGVVSDMVRAGLLRREGTLLLLP